MLVAIGPKRPLATTREWCSAIDRMSSVSRSARRGLVRSPLSIEWTPRCLLAGILPPSSYPDRPRRKVSYRSFQEVLQQREIDSKLLLLNSLSSQAEKAKYKNTASCIWHLCPSLIKLHPWLTLWRFIVTIVDPNSILVRHKKFLKQLERQKNIERDDAYIAATEKENKSKAFKAQAQRQREKIKGLKGADILQ